MTDPVRQLMVPPEAAPTVESLDEPDVVALMVQALTLFALAALVIGRG